MELLRDAWLEGYGFVGAGSPDRDGILSLFKEEIEGLVDARVLEFTGSASDVIFLSSSREVLLEEIRDAVVDEWYAGLEYAEEG